MYFISVWEPKYDAQLICGHSAPAGQKAYKLIIGVCQQDVACLPQAIKVAIQAQKEQAYHARQSLLYRLWHWCFGAKRKKTVPQTAAHEHKESSTERGWKSMPQVKTYTAKQDLHLDCGHRIKAGEALVVTSVYTCPQEGSWPLTILLGCLQVLQQQQAVKQPVGKKSMHVTKNVYTNGSPHQPHA